MGLKKGMSTAWDKVERNKKEMDLLEGVAEVSWFAVF